MRLTITILHYRLSQRLTSLCLKLKNKYFAFMAPYELKMLTDIFITEQRISIDDNIITHAPFG